MDPAEYRRVKLPYGCWTCADGREVLFNRGYQPIWQRHDGVVTECPPHWVEQIVRTCHFYNDGWRGYWSAIGLSEHLEGILSAFQRGDVMSGV